MIHQSKDAFNLFIKECYVRDDAVSMKELAELKDSSWLESSKRCQSAAPLKDIKQQVKKPTFFTRLAQSNYNPRAASSVGFQIKLVQDAKGWPKLEEGDYNSSAINESFKKFTRR